MKRTIAALLAASMVPSISFADWKVRTEKKASLVTGVKDTHAELISRKGRVGLLIGCTDGTPIMRIARNFRLQNSIYDSMTKSRLERAIDKSEKFGFRLTPQNGGYVSRVKIRMGAAREYLDAEVPGGYQDGVYFLFLDSRIGELLPRMLADSTMLAELAYTTGDEVVEFALEGMHGALAQMAEVGCRILTAGAVKTDDLTAPQKSTPDIASEQIPATAVAQMAPPPVVPDFRLTLDAPAGSTVSIDGKPAGSAPLTVALAQGSHLVLIRREGFRPWSRSVVAKPGENQTVSVEMSPEQAAAPVAPGTGYVITGR